MKLDVDPTANVIENMAKQLEETAKQLRLVAERMRAEQSFAATSEAAELVQNLFSALPMDKLVWMPIEALTKAQRQML